MGLAVAMSVAAVQGQEEKETLGDKLKRLFTRPSPTATPRKSHRRPSPSPTISSDQTLASPDQSATIPAYGETPLPKTEPSSSIESFPPVQAKTPETQYFEPVRPISPGPRGRAAPPRIPQVFSSPTVIESPIPNISEERSPADRPTPSLQTIPIPNAESSGSPEALPNAQSSPSAGLSAALNFSPPTSPSPLTRAETPAPQPSVLSESDILEATNYPGDVRKLVELSLDLAKKRLTYKYASADPANGGLDCSGFIYYVLTKSGVKSVPRDAREQYVWVRKAGNFQAVLGHGDETFELDNLKPGDLLFWANNSGLSREPEITQITIYLGRDKATKQRLMIGATEGGTYKGEKNSGVGVFDFKPGTIEENPDEPPASVFVGYGRFPDLSP